jgi:hypothetical protein
MYVASSILLATRVMVDPSLTVSDSAVVHRYRDG